MNKAYDKVTWVNKPSTASPINQTNLNKMSDALDIIDDRVIALDSGKVSSVTVTNTLPTGDTIATITVDGTSTNIKSAQITVDSEISTTSTNPVQNKVIAEALREVMPEVTVEGNPISITDGSNIVPAKLAEVTFLPKQSGSGEPSPDNVRPISGWTEVNLYVDEEQTLSPATTYTESLGATYYGGKVDFVSGEVVIDKAYKVFNGGSGESWSTAQNAFYIDTAFTDASSNFETNGNTCVCNMYAEGNAVSTSSQVSSRSDFSFFNQKGTYYYRLWVKNSNYASVDAFKTALASQNLQIVYPLGTPITLTLTAQQIELLKGANVLWTDGESIKLVYSADIKAWVESQLSNS